MVWYVIAIASFAAAIAMVVIVRVREGRYVRKKTSETISPSIMAELEEEREAAYARRNKFREMLRSVEEKKFRSS